jgi:hypothetical protein
LFLVAALRQQTANSPPESRHDIRRVEGLLPRYKTEKLSRLRFLGET